MASPLRLNEELLRRAEAEGHLHKRSVPKQIEHWAELGRRIERVMNPTDVVAVCEGLAKVEIGPVDAPAANPDEVFAALEQDRASGRLRGSVTAAPVYYEASRSRPGLLDRVHPDGTRETGRFRNGEFEAAPAG